MHASCYIIYLQKGHFFFRFETPESRETWWTLLVDAVKDLKVSPETLVPDDPRYWVNLKEKAYSTWYGRCYYGILIIF